MHQELVQIGYTHLFCTPHVWPNLPHNNPERIRQNVADLQRELDSAGVKLKLFPGGELNIQLLTEQFTHVPIITYNLDDRYVLFDLWADRLPPYFEPQVRRLQSMGLIPILAHPERMRAVQDDPKLVDTLQNMGLLLQGNLQCFGDPPDAPTRLVAERFLCEGRYFTLATDLHNLASLPKRLEGLKRATQLVGHQAIDRLLMEAPRQLLPDSELE